MTDLSGRSRGILYALGTKSVGSVWIIGGYPGSLKRAKAVLKLTPCEIIATAWVLFEPDGPPSIAVEVMPSLVLLFQKIVRKQELARQQKEQVVMLPVARKGSIDQRARSHLESLPTNSISFE